MWYIVLVKEESPLSHNIMQASVKVIINLNQKRKLKRNEDCRLRIVRYIIDIVHN